MLSLVGRRFAPAASSIRNAAAVAPANAKTTTNGFFGGNYPTGYMPADAPREGTSMSRHKVTSTRQYEYGPESPYYGYNMPQTTFVRRGMLRAILYETGLLTRWAKNFFYMSCFAVPLIFIENRRTAKYAYGKENPGQPINASYLYRMSKIFYWA